MSNLTGLAILLVEDDVMLRKRLAAQLERLGAEVVAADDLQTARKLLAGADFDFGLLDVNLPDGLGPDLLREKAFPPQHRRDCHDGAWRRGRGGGSHAAGGLGLSGQTL